MTNDGKFKLRNRRAAHLDEPTVRWVLDRYIIDHWTQRRIATATGVHIGTIGRIVRNETWTNIPRPEPSAPVS
jgi:hypothetical protein